MLIWLDHNMTPSVLRKRVEDAEFRENLIRYLEDIIKEDLSWINPSLINTGLPSICLFDKTSELSENGHVVLR